MEQILIADTNLFFECQRLEDLPWFDLAVDPIVIALTKPVMEEVDKHKTGGGRTRKRAMDVSQRLRAMLRSGQSEQVIRDADPRVVLRLVPIVQPDPNRSKVLDYSHNDDRIVGIVSAMAKDGAAVRLLTDDSGAASTAHSLNLPFILIPESWKRPPEETTEAKRIRELERENAIYKAQEPRIELRNATEAETRLVRRKPLALGGADLDRLVESLRARHPMQESFEASDPETLPDGTVISYEAPDQEAVNKYKVEAYPQWVAQCRAVLESLHEDRVEKEPPLRLLVGLTNSGTRPASLLRISFEALGDIRLRRILRNEDPSDEEDVTADDRPRPWPRLPAPPGAPQVRKIVQRPPSVTVGRDLAALSSPAAGLRIGRQSAVASALESFGGMRSMFDEVDRMAALADAVRIPEATAEVLRYAQEQDRLFASMGRGFPNLDMTRRDHLFDIASMRPHIPPPRDPETFYFDEWAPRVLVSRGALTCDLFRHRQGEELFECEVVFVADGDVSGAVLCTVHAENLTEPTELRIPVWRTIEEFDLLERAEAIVAS
jgi:hypothetical protein